MLYLLFSLCFTLGLASCELFAAYSLSVLDAVERSRHEVGEKLGKGGDYE